MLERKMKGWLVLLDRQAYRTVIFYTPDRHVCEDNAMSILLS